MKVNEDKKDFKTNTVGDIFSANPKIISRNVSVYYNNKKAISDVSLDIGSKEIISLIGPSGCGKSTFLRCFNRMNDTIDGCKVEGKIFLDNENIYDEMIDVVPLRAKVGMVFQKPNPFPKSIYDNVAYGPRIHGLVDNKKDMDNIVELSLCSALDPIATAKIEELLQTLANDYSIVIVTHSMQQAARVSQRTAYFHLGELVEVGYTKHIFTNPTDIKTQNYITGRIG